MQRYASKTQSTPAWLTEAHYELFNLIYAEAKELTKTTGVQYHVDHIVPLRGKTVCGLHVPWNLRPIPARENRQKKNRLIEELL